MKDSIIKHFPVMATNVLNKMRSFPKMMPLKIADCNFGLGGHSKLILKHYPNAQIQAYDLDPKVIDYFKQNYSKELTQQQQKRLTITQSNFSSIQSTKIFDKFNIILADFGFCSYHLQTQRGFSWLKNQQLDMRYSSQGRTCAEIINTSSQLQLMAILKRYGDLKGAKSIAQVIVEARPIRTTEELRDAVVKCFQDDKTRKIAQVFQAFRIATNNELKDIEKLCLSMEKCLQKDGYFLGVTFHSLQRDIIHNFLRDNKKIYSKAEIELPSDQELETNSKSKSARMISFKKLK